MLRTDAGDRQPAWYYQAGSYLHTDCGGRVLFHANGHGLPNAALCPDCGAAWQRKTTEILKRDWENKP